MSVVAGEVSLVDRFRELQPEVVASFGGSEFLFARWWEDVSETDPPDVGLAEDYSTNDRWLANRLILPEEIPFLVLPVVRAALRCRAESVFFLERGTFPYLEAARRILEEVVEERRIRCEPVRIKGLTRESFAVNLLSLLTTDPEDSARLAEPPAAPLRARLAAWLRSGDSEARAVAIEARQLGLDPADLLDAPLEVVLLELSDLGLDDRVRIPNALKSVVFRAGEAMRHAPLTAGALRAHVDESLLRLAHGASGAIDELIGLATLPDGTVSLPLLLDGMNRSVQGLRGSLTHTARPLLNSLLADTRTGTALFGSDNALFVDEVSVCGSACVTLEVLGRAFRPRFRGSFGSIVGMWAHASFLDIAAASFFTLKPLEDVPFLSPHLFVPVEWNEVRPVRPHRFPSGRALARRVVRWERRTLAEELERLGEAEPRAGAEEIRSFRRKLATALTERLPWQDFPVLRRRADWNPDLLPALVLYYLGSFESVAGELWYRRDPWLEAGLERVLGDSGRFQKPFYREMDRLFAFLEREERNMPHAFAPWRTAWQKRRAGLRRLILEDALQAGRRFRARMESGMDAISRSRAAVLRFLFARGSEDREGFPGSSAPCRRPWDETLSPP